MGQDKERQVLILTGEESGDLHGAHLARAFQRLPVPPRLFGYGGKHLQEAGVELVENTLQTSVVGISEIFMALPNLIARARRIVNFIKNQSMDLLILIDFPGFHLWILPQVSRFVPTVYYIPPKVWVWKENRAQKIMRFCQRVYTIFPFEQRYFPEKSKYFGHPLLDIVASPKSRDEFLESRGLSSSRRYIGLVPGSRLQEIRKMLPIFLDVAKRLSEEADYGFLLPQASSLELQEYKKLDPQIESRVTLCEGDTYSLISACDLILATSGTVTLEAAILGTPMLICNKGSSLTYAAFRMLSKVRHLGLPNILKNQEICPEYLQDDANVDRLVHGVREFLAHDELLAKQRKQLGEVREILGEPGVLDRITRDMQESYLQ